MVLFLGLLFQVSHGQNFAVGMFTRADFAIKDDQYLSKHRGVKACQKSHTCGDQLQRAQLRLYHRDFNMKRISGYLHLIYIQLTSGTHLYAIIHSQSTPPPPSGSRSYLHYPPITCCKTQNTAVPCSPV